MAKPRIAFDHIHVISRDPQAAARWYADVLGGEVVGDKPARGAPQITVRLDGAVLLVRGKRPGENPTEPNPIAQFADYASHDSWGMDHFGVTVGGDFIAYCDELRRKGVAFETEPYEFLPGVRIAYIAAPDGVTVELVEAKD